MDHQAKEALRKEKESPKGKGDRREFRGEKWEELGWRLSEHQGLKWTLTLKEEKCLREDLDLPTGRGKLGKWVGRDPEDAVWIRGKLAEMRELISRVGRRRGAGACNGQVKGAQKTGGSEDGSRREEGGESPN